MGRLLTKSWISLYQISTALSVAILCGVVAYTYIAGGSWSTLTSFAYVSDSYLGLSYTAGSDAQPLKSTVGSDAQLLEYVRERERFPVPSPPNQLQKIAFLFLTGGSIPFEPLWRRFFAGQDERRYSIYAFVGSGNYSFPENSLFYQKEVRGKSVNPNLGDTLRWLLAVALLDAKNYNTWFVNVCRTTIPLRSFNFTYDYLTSSRHSFVQSFTPTPRFRSWNTQPEFDQSQLQKGEVWMALLRKHALLIVKDRRIYPKFAANSRESSLAFEEGYFQTLLHLRDPRRISNRTVFFVDWSDQGRWPSPRIFDLADMSFTQSFLHKMVTMKVDTVYGAHHFTAEDNRPVTCTHNGVEVLCFLFGRKFQDDCLEMLIGLQIPNI